MVFLYLSKRFCRNWKVLSITKKEWQREFLVVEIPYPYQKDFFVCRKQTLDKKVVLCYFWLPQINFPLAGNGALNNLRIKGVQNLLVSPPKKDRDGLFLLLLRTQMVFLEIGNDNLLISKTDFLCFCLSKDKNIWNIGLEHPTLYSYWLCKSQESQSKGVGTSGT